ncbi:MAG: YigZ family protein [bacterium]
MNSLADYYFTVASSHRAPELKVKGSRFIADIIPVSSRDQVSEHLLAISKEFYDASHHCYAYRIGRPAELVRSADDGEPSGTAGKPILLALTSKEITNCLLVVTRYFGGTELGTGGLARAYAEAAKHAIETATIKQVLITESYHITLSYEDFPILERIVAPFSPIIEKQFGDQVIVKLQVRKSLAEQCMSAIKRVLYNTVVIVDLNGG